MGYPRYTGLQRLCIHVYVWMQGEMFIIGTTTSLTKLLRGHNSDDGSVSKGKKILKPMNCLNIYVVSIVTFVWCNVSNINRSKEEIDLSIGK